VHKFWLVKGHKDGITVIPQAMVTEDKVEARDDVQVVFRRIYGDDVVITSVEEFDPPPAVKANLLKNMPKEGEIRH
jgi:hypothetical protein